MLHVYSTVCVCVWCLLFLVGDCTDEYNWVLVHTVWRIVSDTLPRQLCRGREGGREEREGEGGREGEKKKRVRKRRKGERGVKKHKEKQVKVNDVNRLVYL